MQSTYKVFKALEKIKRVVVVPSNLVQRLRKYSSFYQTCQKWNGKSPSFLLIFNHLAFWHPFTLFSAVNKRIELQAWDWTQIKAYCKGFPYLISFFVLDILKLILYELQINFILISPAVWWQTQLILALMLIIVSWRHRDFGKTIDTDFLKQQK